MDFMNATPEELLQFASITIHCARSGDMSMARPFAIALLKTNPEPHIIITPRAKIVVPQGTIEMFKTAKKKGAEFDFLVSIVLLGLYAFKHRLDTKTIRAAELVTRDLLAIS
jgi:hypothetical protein